MLLDVDDGYFPELPISDSECLYPVVDYIFFVDVLAGILDVGDDKVFPGFPILSNSLSTLVVSSICWCDFHDVSRLPFYIMSGVGLVFVTELFTVLDYFFICMRQALPFVSVPQNSYSDSVSTSPSDRLDNS